MQHLSGGLLVTFHILILLISEINKYVRFGWPSLLQMSVKRSLLQMFWSKSMEFWTQDFINFFLNIKSEFFSKNTYHRIAVDSDHFCLNSSIDQKPPSLANTTKCSLLRDNFLPPKHPKKCSPLRGDFYPKKCSPLRGDFPKKIQTLRFLLSQNIILCLFFRVFF